MMMLLASLAFGYDVRVCGEWTPDLLDAQFSDNDGLDANGDGIVNNDVQDRLTDNSPLRAHGLLVDVQVLNDSTGLWETQASGHLRSGGVHGGCTTVVTLTSPTGSGGPIAVRMAAVTSVKASDHTLTVMDNDVDQLLGFAISNNTSVSLLSSDKVYVDFGGGDERFDAAIMMAWALSHDDGGLSSLYTPKLMDLDVYTCHDPGSAANCLSATEGSAYFHGSGELYVGDDSSSKDIFRTLGYAIMGEWAINTSTPWITSESWTNVDFPVPPPASPIDADSACEVWDGDPYASEANYQESDEASSSAIIEGFADFYWAATVNNTDEADCFVRGGFHDWDHDGVDEASAWFNCEGRPTPTLPTMNNRDFWAGQCTVASPSGSTEDLMAARYDWLRGLWDMRTDEGWDTESIMRHLAFAGADSWFPYPYSTQLGGCSTIECPKDRMMSASAGVEPQNLRYLHSYQAQCNNGICR